MSIEHLQLRQCRNIRHAKLELGPRLNIISGANASGKTSLLEAVYLLGTGRSFRTNCLQHVIQAETETFTVTAKLRSAAGSGRQVGFEYSKNGRVLRIDGQNVRRSIEMAELLPLRLINQQSFDLIDQGPAFRRKFLDWGVFHVEQGFYSVWQRYMRALKQRNAALRQRRANTGVWEREMSEMAAQLHAMRSRYVERLRPVLLASVQTMLRLDDITLDYRAGWDTTETLQQVLSKEAARDREQGYTRSGPQRAEIVFKRAGMPVRERLSRGQQKLLISALILGQARLLADAKGINSIVLLDDIVAELDHTHCGRLMEALVDTGAQLLVTAIDAAQVPIAAQLEKERFHVEHGVVKKML